jgi:hypothetical protein
LKTWDPRAWVQMMVLRTWIRTRPRGPVLCHALRTSIFLDLGSWTHGPDDGSQDLDQDRPRGPLLCHALRTSIFLDLGSWTHGPDEVSEDLDQDRPRGPFTLSCFEDLDF